MIVLKQRQWCPVELSLVQILVLVANNPMRSRMTEVEKGFTWSLLRREWPGPKRILNWFELSFLTFTWKGNRLIFLWCCHDVKRWRYRTGWRQRGPWKEFSFLFNKTTVTGIGLSWDGECCLAKQMTFSSVRCDLDGPWKTWGLFASVQQPYS